MFTTKQLPANSDIFAFIFSRQKQVHTGDVIFIVVNSIVQLQLVVQLIVQLRALNIMSI